MNTIIYNEETKRFSMKYPDKRKYQKITIGLVDPKVYKNTPGSIIATVNHGRYLAHLKTFDVKGLNKDEIKNMIKSWKSDMEKEDGVSYDIKFQSTGDNKWYEYRVDQDPPLTLNINKNSQPAYPWSK